MRRILHIVGTMDRAGAETMIMNLYRVIDREKFQFDFLYFTSKKCDFDEEIEELGGKIFRILETNPINRMLATKKFLLKNKQWETIHAHTLFSNAFHIFAAYKAGVKQRISHAHSNNDGINTKTIGAIYHYISRNIQSRYATNFVACSSAAGRYLFPDKKNVLVLKNSIDIECFTTIGERKREYLKQMFQLSDDTKILLQIGRLNSPKNHQFTLQILRELKKENFKFKVFFAGEGALLNKLEQRVDEYNLKNEVIFLGLRADVPSLLAGADLMLMPSLYEGFGMVLIEAQAAGTPSLISSTIPSDSDLGIGLINVNSLLESPEMWAKHILDILNSNLRVDKDIRILKLRKYGYDHNDSVANLCKLYNS